MSQKYKYSFKQYSAWNYQEATEDYDKLSEHGWQLVKTNLFYNKYVKNENIRYRYQLDFRKIEDRGRYIETFREQGWEYVDSTLNGWHCFRKLYDSSLPDEEYEIFTDRESLTEMNRSWSRVAFIICAFLGIFAVFNGIRLFRQPSLPVLLQFLTFAIECTVLFRGGMIMHKPDSNHKKRGGSTFLAVFFATICIGSALSIFLTYKRPNFTTQQCAAAIDSPIVDDQWMDFEVKYPDNYYLNLELDSNKPITFEILSKSGESVYKVTDTNFSEQNIRLKLNKGQYCFSMSCDTGYNIKCKVN